MKKKAIKSDKTARKKIKKPNLAASAKNATIIAWIVGGRVEIVGPRHMVFFYSSQKLSKIDGSAECRDKTVSLTLADLTVAEAASALAILTLVEKTGKRRKNKLSPIEALHRESALAERNQILAKLRQPPEKRTNSLRIRLPPRGGSAL